MLHFTTTSRTGWQNLRRVNCETAALWWPSAAHFYDSSFTNTVGMASHQTEPTASSLTVCFMSTDFMAWKHLGGQWPWEPLASETGQGLRVQLLDCSQSWTQMELGTSMGFTVPAVKLLLVSSSLMELLTKLQILAWKQNFKMKPSSGAVSLFLSLKAAGKGPVRWKKGLLLLQEGPSYYNSDI